MVTQYEEKYNGRQKSCHMVFAAEELTVKLCQEFGSDTTFERQMDA